jgi:hypothetical protein
MDAGPRPAGGQITVEGPFLDAGHSTLAVTGGPGRNRNARGFMKLHSLESGTKFASRRLIGAARDAVVAPCRATGQRAPVPLQVPRNARGCHDCNG